MVSLVYADGEINSNMNIVLFLLLLGVLTALLTVSGSNRAFAEWAQSRIKDRRGAKLLAASLVFVTFIDDYFHSLAVGAIARPVTDRFKVSRAKLAYILDSTAAPMCVMMPVSSWGAYYYFNRRFISDLFDHGVHTNWCIRSNEFNELLCNFLHYYGVFVAYFLLILLQWCVTKN